MKHRVAFRKLGRDYKKRWALLRTMVDQLVNHERIKTTEPKAKELRRFADWVVTLGKRGDKHARGQAAALMRTNESISKVFDVLAPRYANRPGGYTRICKIGHRRGDNADMAVIEFVDREGEIRPARAVDENSIARNSKSTLPPFITLLNSRNWKLTPSERRKAVQQDTQEQSK